MILRRVAWTLAGLGVLLGVGHMTFLTGYGRWSLDALWFAGTGLAFIFGGLINVAALRAGEDRLVQASAIGSNVLLVGFFSLAWLVLPVPQVIGGGLIFAGLAAAALLARLRQA